MKIKVILFFPPLYLLTFHPQYLTYFFRVTNDISPKSKVVYHNFWGDFVGANSSNLMFILFPSAHFFIALVPLCRFLDILASVIYLNISSQKLAVKHALRLHCILFCNAAISCLMNPFQSRLLVTLAFIVCNCCLILPSTHFYSNYFPKGRY